MTGLRKAAPVNGQARWLVCLAAATSVMAAVWLSKATGHGVVVYSIYGALVATPLLAQDARSFTRACRIGALVLVLFGLFGLFLRLFYFWPAAVFLVLASHVTWETGRRLRLMVSSGTLLAVMAAAGWGAAIYETALKPADAFIVSFDSERSEQAASASIKKGGALGAGAGETQVSERNREWLVQFRKGLGSDEQVQLQEELRGLPGVTRVRLCSRWNGEC